MDSYTIVDTITSEYRFLINRYHVLSDYPYENTYHYTYSDSGYLVCISEGEGYTYDYLATKECLYIKELYGSIHDKEMKSVQIEREKKTKSIGRKKKKRRELSRGLFGRKSNKKDKCDFLPGDDEYTHDYD